ncbi:MAG: alpha-galactosidase [Clostridia bacterium]|nr:alpha-galactosidase [Clostridia bacterium]
MVKYVIAGIIILIVVLFLLWCLHQKKQGLCPICTLKQFVCKSKLTIRIPGNEFYNGGDAPTPPMGWSSWNSFRNNIDENLIYDTAVALKESGLAEAGYKYVNLDDCWHSSVRDENGCLQGDLSLFSSGIDTLCAKINALGLKMGLYSSNGDYTCEDLPASLGYEKKDADTFARWGVEYFKYDFCHNVKIPSVAPLVEKVEIRMGEKTINLVSDDAKLSGLACINNDKRLESGKYISFLGQGKGKAEFNLDCEKNGSYPLTLVVKKSGRYTKYLIVQVNDKFYEMFFPETKAWSTVGRYQCEVELNKGENRIALFNPVCTRADSAYIQYKRMGEALRNASPDKPITYSICEWGRNNPKNWAWNAGNLWRTTPDIRPYWKWINIIYNKNLALAEFAGPGHWNDPDMLEVGNGKLTVDENRTHFSLWCMMSAPLILGNDIRKYNVDSNDDVLEILKNRQMIAIDQDELGHQCVRYKRTSKADWLVKKLSGNRHAVCIYNRTSKLTELSFNSSDLPAEITQISEYTEVWSNKKYKGQAFKIAVNPHGCAVFVSK